MLLTELNSSIMWSLQI